MGRGPKGRQPQRGWVQVRSSTPFLGVSLDTIQCRLKNHPRFIKESALNTRCVHDTKNRKRTWLRQAMIFIFLEGLSVGRLSVLVQKS